MGPVSPRSTKEPKRPASTRTPRWAAPAAVLLAFRLAWLPATAWAQDAEAGRTAFEAGVQAAEARDWERAAHHFERSLELAPRVAAAFNLVVAEAHLEHWSSVIRTSDRMLELADPTRHRRQRLQVLRLRERAMEHLVELRLRVSPPDASVTVDGRARPGHGPGRTLWLEPGDHEVRVTSGGHEPQTLAVSGEVGQRIALGVTLSAGAHRSDAAREAHRSDPEARSSGETSERVDAPASDQNGSPVEGPTLSASAPRRLIAISTTAIGVAAFGAGVVAQSTAMVRAAALRDSDPQRSGFLSATTTYRRWRAASAWLSIGGALAVSAAIAITEWRLSLPAWWWALAAGTVFSLTGAVLAARRPARIGETRLTEPYRSLGTLLLGLGVPLVVAPTLAFVDPADRPTMRATGTTGTVGLAALGMW